MKLCDLRRGSYFINLDMSVASHRDFSKTNARVCLPQFYVKSIMFYRTRFETLISVCMLYLLKAWSFSNLKSLCSETNICYFGETKECLKIRVGLTMANHCYIVVWFKYFVVDFMPYLQLHRGFTGHKMHIPALVITLSIIPNLTGWPSYLSKENYVYKSGGERHKCLRLNMAYYKRGWLQLLLLDGVETTKEANGLKLFKGKYSHRQCWKAHCSYSCWILNFCLSSCFWTNVSGKEGGSVANRMLGTFLLGIKKENEKSTH